MLFGVLDMPLRGNRYMLILAGILFILADQFTGVLLALLLRPMASAISIGTLLMAPAFGFMSTFALPIPPGPLTGIPSQAYGTLRYHVHCCTSSASVHGFSPVTFSAQRPLFRPVSCYAFFK